MPESESCVRREVSTIYFTDFAFSDELFSAAGLGICKKEDVRNGIY